MLEACPAEGLKTVKLTVDSLKRVIDARETSLGEGRDVPVSGQHSAPSVFKSAGEMSCKNTTNENTL